MRERGNIYKRRYKIKLSRIIIMDDNSVFTLYENDHFDTTEVPSLSIHYCFFSRSQFRVQHVIIIGAVVAALIIAVIIGLSAYARSGTSDSRNENEFLMPPDPESFQPPSWSKLRTFKRGAVCADGAPCAVIGKYVYQRHEFFNS